MRKSKYNSFDELPLMLTVEDVSHVLGIGLVVLQYYFNIVHLDPATYYVDAVPVLFNAGYILAINAATAFISVFVLILPSLLVSRIHPAKSIRFE